MYILEPYWNALGDSDDGLTLTAYLADQGREELSVGEILAGIGLDRLDGDFRQHEEPLTAVLTHADSDYEEPYVEFYYAIEVIAALAALLLECKVNGSVNVQALSGEELDAAAPEIRITASPEDRALIDAALKDFAAEPFAYDLSESMPEEELLEMAALCEKLRQELCRRAE